MQSSNHSSPVLFSSFTGIVEQLEREVVQAWTGLCEALLQPVHSSVNHPVKPGHHHQSLDTLDTAAAKCPNLFTMYVSSPNKPDKLF